MRLSRLYRHKIGSRYASRPLAARRKKDKVTVASVAAYNEEGKLLFGLRNDSEKWTLPGGHAEEGEDPRDAAVRELKEETGLDAGELEYLGDGYGGRDRTVHVFCYRTTVTGSPTVGQDPDDECSVWAWVDESEIPGVILENLHNKRNITLDLLGLMDKTAQVEDDDYDEYERGQQRLLNMTDEYIGQQEPSRAEMLWDRRDQARRQLDRRNRQKQWDNPESAQWPDANMLETREPPPPRVKSVPAGTVLLHGTANEREFEVPTWPTSFTTDMGHASAYADPDMGPSPRIMKYTVKTTIPNLVWIPAQKDQLDGARYWLGKFFGVSFERADWTSDEAMTTAVCSRGYNGLYLETIVSGGDEIRLCDPSKWVEFNGAQQPSDLKRADVNVVDEPIDDLIETTQQNTYPAGELVHNPGSNHSEDVRIGQINSLNDLSSTQGGQWTDSMQSLHNTGDNQFEDVKLATPYDDELGPLSEDVDSDKEYNVVRGASIKMSDLIKEKGAIALPDQGVDENKYEDDLFRTDNSIPLK
jgi:8-oxo-dGTP pyrophosphatase MutT (NUDIX family)